AKGRQETGEGDGIPESLLRHDEEAPAVERLAAPFRPADLAGRQFPALPPRLVAPEAAPVVPSRELGQRQLDPQLGVVGEPPRAILQYPDRLVVAAERAERLADHRDRGEIVGRLG